MTDIIKFYHFTLTENGSELSNADTVDLADPTSSFAIRRTNDLGVVLTPSQAPALSNPTVGIYTLNLTTLNLDPAYTYEIAIRYGTLVSAGNYQYDYDSQILLPGDVRGESRASIRRRIGNLILGQGKFEFGPVVSATTTTFSSQFLAKYPDNVCAGRVAYVVSGNGTGQLRVVSGNTQGTKSATIQGAWDTVPDSSSIIELWSDLISPDRVNDAINLAILDAHDVSNVYVQEVGPTLSSSRTQITVPDNFVKVSDVSYYDPSRDEWVRYSPADWFSEREPQCKLLGGIIQLNPKIPDAISADNIYVSGYRLPLRLLTDSDVSDIRPDYLVYMAAYYLEAGDAEGPTLDPEQHSGRAGNWLRAALLIRNELPTRWEPSTLEVRR